MCLCAHTDVDMIPTIHLQSISHAILFTVAVLAVAIYHYRVSYFINVEESKLQSKGNQDEDDNKDVQVDLFHYVECILRVS